MHSRIVFCPGELKKAIDRINKIPPEHLSSTEAIAAQSDLEIAIRKLIASIPNELFDTRDRTKEFLTSLRGSLPSNDLVELVRRKTRSLRLSEEQHIEIERRQGYRCCWCGVLLAAKSSPHV